MMRVHVLSPGFSTPNGRAFLYPLIVWRQALRDCGFDCQIGRNVGPSLTDCDVLLVDSKFHRDLWANNAEQTIEQFHGWAEKCAVIYCDTTDSAGWLQAALLPVVRGYAKAQLLKDRSRYLSPMYGQRAYTDYYYREFGIVDSEPKWSATVGDPTHLKKLRLSWNSGLSDHSLYGPLNAEIYRRLPLLGLVHFPSRFTPPDVPRAQGFSCRFGVSYLAESIGFQRRRIRELIGMQTDTRKLGRRNYLNELRTSKVVVSPFGYGEITLKDFEVFLTGGLLFKPDMTGIETWPDLFCSNETMITHSWDLANFVERLEATVARYVELRDIALAAQARYRDHIAGPRAAELFVKQFRSVVLA
jgi:hypothetical protein